MRICVFEDGELLAAGTVADVAATLQAAVDRGATAVALDAATGQVIDLDLRGTPQEVAARHANPPRRGRPKLGVKAREVTLLPRHWTWLASQRGGASAALRRLVEAEMRSAGAAPDPRMARDAAYRAATVLAGDRPGYEDAIRALYAGDLDAMEELAAAWPDAVRRFVLALARGTGG